MLVTGADFGPRRGPAQGVLRERAKDITRPGREAAELRAGSRDGKPRGAARPVARQGRGGPGASYRNWLARISRALARITFSNLDSAVGEPRRVTVLPWVLFFTYSATLMLSVRSSRPRI